MSHYFFEWGVKDGLSAVQGGGTVLYAPRPIASRNSPRSGENPRNEGQQLKAGA
jgi:hypothetical protein